ncbi:MAG: hypothetical protein GY703_23770 [Gammaproteobacteria bacterium]|nr:hypothetical protein [Gammaproteobacteria bacterium]
MPPHFAPYGAQRPLGVLIALQWVFEWNLLEGSGDPSCYRRGLKKVTSTNVTDAGAIYGIRICYIDGLRAVVKMNHPILLVSHLSYRYRHPASRESSPSMDVVCVADSVA